MKGAHVSADRLEEYCLGRVPAAELAGVEEHLLVCQACQDRLRDTDRYIRVMRSAITAIASEPAAGQESGWAQWFGRRGRLAPAAAAGVAALVLVWAVAPLLDGPRNGAPVAVTLEAMRGGESLRVHAPAKTPLRLTLDLTGLTLRESYLVRIVDAAGAPVFEAEARQDRTHLDVEAPARLPRGVYWIRVEERAAAGTPLREYGLELK